MTRPRLLDKGHPDRSLSVEAALEPAYQALVADAAKHGVAEEEAALAIESLAQANLDTIAANRQTEAEIARARREVGLSPDLYPLNPPRDYALIAPPPPPSARPWVYAGAGWTVAAICFAMWAIG